MGQTTIWPDPVTLDNWRAPLARRDSARRHVAAVLGSFQDSGEAGAVSRYEILRRYPEICWMEGLKPLSENELCTALGRRCAKPRKKIQLGKGKTKIVVHYVIPFVRPQAEALGAPAKPARPALAAAA